MLTTCVSGCFQGATKVEMPPMLCECGLPEPPPVVVPVPPAATGAGDSGPDRIAITFDVQVMDVPINPLAFAVTGSTPTPAPAATSAFVSAPGVVTVVFAAPVTFAVGATVTYTVPAPGTGLIRSMTGTPAEDFTVPIT